MNRESSTIVINKKHYNRSNLCMLTGLEETSSLDDYLKKNAIPSDILNIAWVLEKPSRLPVMLAELYNISKEESIGVRLALARAQIDAALSMNENLQKYTKQKFVAETVERIIFGNLLLEGKSSKNSGSNGDENGKINEKKKPRTKRETGKKKTTKGSGKGK